MPWSKVKHQRCLIHTSKFHWAKDLCLDLTSPHFLAACWRPFKGSMGIKAEIAILASKAFTHSSSWVFSLSTNSPLRWLLQHWVLSVADRMVCLPLAGSMQHAVCPRTLKERHHLCLPCFIMEMEFVSIWQAYCDIDQIRVMIRVRLELSHSFS